MLNQVHLTPTTQKELRNVERKGFIVYFFTEMFGD
jgi:hypothetical protein